MIIVEHDWTLTEGDATVCRNCGLVCDTHQGGFVDPETGDVSMRPSPCPLVPESRHTPGPWRWVMDVLVPEPSNDGGWILSAELNQQSEWLSLQAQANKALIERAPVMRDALEAVLLFYRAAEWTEECRARWLELTGSTEATTKVLADTVRRALR